MNSASTDPALVRLAQAGDPEAWDRLFQRYQRPLYIFIVELLRDEPLALDLVQETFINACRHVGTLREPARFGSWLFGIAHQKCRLQARRRSVVDPWHGDWEEAPSDETASGHRSSPTDEAQLDPARWLLQAEQADELIRCLGQLPEPQRALLLLRFVDDFSLADIAEITGVPVGTVKSRLHHARQAFRHLFESLPI